MSGSHESLSLERPQSPSVTPATQLDQRIDDGVDSNSADDVNRLDEVEIEKTQNDGIAENEERTSIKESPGGGPEDKDAERAESNVSAPPPLYSVFSQRKKAFIITMAGLGGFFSPFSASIYFPALNALSQDLHVSSGLINLSLTTYMIFQGLAPTFIGGLADTAGRRPCYIISFVIYIGACIGLALQDNYAALLILRCVQSSGSSSTIALASGIGGDIATASERGKWMGWVNAGSLLGPAVGPILGGILSEFLGWRWIFWFLAILGGAYMIPLVLAFPETGRRVVDDGSIPPQKWNRTIIDVLVEALKKGQSHGLERTESRKTAHSVRSEMAEKRKFRFPNPFKTLKLLLEKDVGMLLLFNSLLYTAFYCVIATVPDMFAQTYHFNDLQIGLAFIPFGVGNFLAPLLNGRLMDWQFRRVARQLGVPIHKGRATDTRTFPLERVRVPLAAILMLVGNSTLLVYGWVMDINAPLAAPLVLLFIMGYTLTGSFTCLSVMLIDYYPMSPASATACMNLCRCLLGAGGTAVVIYMIQSMGRGWCFTFISLIIYLTTPILWILLKWGPKWREQRMQRAEAKDRAANTEKRS